MKRVLSLSALMLSICGGACAQSSVTLYGLVDLNLSNTRSGEKVGGDRSITTMNDGTANGLNGSRWGVRVSEDLGDGLKAGAVLESGILADNGTAAQGGRAFGRQAFLSLGSARMGELRLGRQYIFEDGVMGLSNPFGNALTLNPGTGVSNMGKALPMWLNAPRADNVVQYVTPTLAGFNAGVQVAPGEGTADRFHGLKLGYAQGPLVAGASYEWNKSRSTGDSLNKSLTVTANYNFGSFKLLGGVQRNKDLAANSGNGAFVATTAPVVTGASTFTVTKLTGYTMGAELPMGQFLLGANYTSVKYESASGASDKLGKVGLGARYGLSKNTFVYTSVSLATGGLKDYIAQQRVVQGGLRMAF